MHGSHASAASTVTVTRFGMEREPVVTIDNFSGRIDDLARQGRLATYAEEPMYPGRRSPADRGYLEPMADLVAQILRRVFAIAHARIEACDYSIVARAADDLLPAQRIPHHDDTEPDCIALLHYAQGPESGGTGFYRQRRTGFETVRPERLAAYRAALMADDAEFGPPAPGYIQGDTERYQRIGAIEARPDRAILYRGRTLHSGIIPRAPDPERATAAGRLTINTFFVAQRQSFETVQPAASPPQDERLGALDSPRSS